MPTNEISPIEVTIEPNPTEFLTNTPQPSGTNTPTPENTVTKTPRPHNTQTPTDTLTPTATPSPGFSFPQAKVKMQAHCRYGPAKSYLHAGDLYAGDTGSIEGRNNTGTWLLIKFDKLWYYCWAAASVLDIQGDIFTLYVAPVRLPKSTLYGPPQNVRAIRQGDTVTVSWDTVWMTEDDDRGYFLEAWLCQNGAYFWTAAALPNQFQTAFTFTDQPGCSQPSRALLYTVEKHGYTDPVIVPWP